MEVAHGIVEQAIRRLVHPAKSVVYIDGAPAAEKQGTHDKRRSSREKAIAKGHQELQKLQERVQSNSQPKKQQFRSVEKCISQGFQWSSKERDSLASHLESKGFSVLVCTTEADVINTIWRPVTKTKLLIYDIQDVTKTLGITRQQLTALGVVSRNDYTRNIPSLGCATNFGIVKQLKGDDVEALVRAYLSHEHVVSKNTKKETFDTSIQVFVKKEQTPLPLLDDSTSRFRELVDAYDCVKRRYAEKRGAIQEETEKRKRSEPVDTCNNRAVGAFASYAE
ncbi:hypothetical protein BGX34_005488 [Mortierella sp. NVP85]|nr:hypothetical protein BGX34_005488 [Mortierella sp. NVP85]